LKGRKKGVPAPHREKEGPRLHTEGKNRARRAQKGKDKRGLRGRVPAQFGKRTLSLSCGFWEDMVRGRRDRGGKPSSALWGREQKISCRSREGGKKKAGDLEKNGGERERIRRKEFFSSLEEKLSRGGTALTSKRE